MGVKDFSIEARPKNAEDLHHWARRLFKGEDSVDVQELTESIVNMNAKSQLVINSTNSDNMWITQLFCYILAPRHPDNYCTVPFAQIERAVPRSWTQ